MNISIFGLGYVGAVSAACFAELGFQVIGVDPQISKVEAICSGRSPVMEPGLEASIQSSVANGRISATTDIRAAVEATEISLVCVGTPSQNNGSLDLRFVRRVCEDIGSALRTIDRFHVVVIRSTMLPGSTTNIVIPALEAASGKQEGVDFAVAYHPEFLREGSAMADFRKPSRTVVGFRDPRAAVISSLYASMPNTVESVAIEESELIKYVDNGWHALKVAFGNEIAVLANRLGVDGRRVMELFAKDTTLNLSPVYLRPGFAFGGSCLPKDLRALDYRIRSLDLDLPLVQSILRSNQLHLERGYQELLRMNIKKIGLLGLSFKPRTDDLRESPLVELVERLLGKGYDFKIYDENVRLSALTGANKDYLLNHIPHVSRLLCSELDVVLEHAEVLVIGHNTPEFVAALDRLRPGQQVLDLAGMRLVTAPEGYRGLCW